MSLLITVKYLLSNILYIVRSNIVLSTITNYIQQSVT